VGRATVRLTSTSSICIQCEYPPQHVSASASASAAAAANVAASSCCLQEGPHPVAAGAGWLSFPHMLPLQPPANRLLSSRSDHALQDDPIQIERALERGEARLRDHLHPDPYIGAPCRRCGMWHGPAC